jgi:hypothetical protein
MRDDKKDGTLPQDFIKSIERSIDERIKPLSVTKRKGGGDIDWSKIKENVELLKKKCAEFSEKIEDANSIKAEQDLARQAKEIRNDWLEIKAMMDRKK